MAFNGGGQAHDRSSSPTSSLDRAESPPTQSFYVQALYAYSGVDTSSLSFRQGDIIEVLSTLESGWWDGVICDQKIRGWFPSNYVEQISDEDAARARQAMTEWWDGDDSGKRRSVVSSRSERMTLGGVAEDLRSLSVGRGGGGLDDFATADDLTSFSNGGDIFSEIAAAAQADSSYDPPTLHHRQSVYTDASSSLRRSVDGEEEDFWVPKVSNSGQLLYYNSKTGETSRDMPIDGQGDGVGIDPREFAREDTADYTIKRSVGKPSTALDWISKMSPDGSGAYYENLRTGEKSRDSPEGRGGFAGVTPRGRDSTGDASLLSGWTERPSASAKEDVRSLEGKADTLRRLSIYSDDSELDVDFGPESVARRAGKGKEIEPPEVIGTNQLTLTQKARKGSSTAQLLDAQPPPLLSELEDLVASALQNLINAAGIGGMVRHAGSPADRAEERDNLALLGDAAVTAVRTLLHATGVLEQSLASGSSRPPSRPVNQILGAFATSPTLSLNTQSELRPFTRRVTSTLSKLVLSVRAVWGILETTQEDQMLDEDDGTGDAEDLARRELAREQMSVRWTRAREVRLETEAKLRSEVLAGARDVQSNVLVFLSEFERLAAGDAATNGGPVLHRATLRAPKALHGSLKTNAAALLLPGGGFGGNWRGNGFVTLPTPHSTPSFPSSVSEPTPLSYSYPAQPLSPSVAQDLQQSSAILLEQVEALLLIIHAVSSAQPTPGRGLKLDGPEVSPTQLLDQAAQLQRELASFLGKVEDIDVASAVDFELPSDSRPGSTRDGMSTSGSVKSLSIAGKSDYDSAGDPSITAEYRTSVQEARPLLAELETRKQALYDISPRLLLALQALYITHSTGSSFASTPGSQPRSNAALAVFSPPPRTNSGPAPILEVLSDLSSGISGLCTILVSLGTLAQKQSAAPSHLRRRSVAFRSSLFDPLSNGILASSAHSFTSSRQSLHRSEDDHAELSSYSRESVDSDFFFSGSAAPPSVKTKTSSKQLFSPLIAGWEKRRGSVATNSTSVSSQMDAQSQASLSQGSLRLSPSKSMSNSKLAKILGGDPTDGSTSPTSRSTGSEPIPTWLGADYGPDEVSFNMEGQIKGGTLRALVIAAASHEGRVDSNYLSAFLMTYRTFCTSHQLLDLLLERYLIEPPEGLNADELKEWETRKLRPIRARVANVLKSWVREHMDHDHYDPELLHRIADFAANTMRDPVQSPQITKAVEERLSGAAPRAVGNLAPGALPPSIVPRNFRKIKFVDIDPLELARQLTIMDGRLFSKITPQECLGKAWPKEYGSEAPNISAMIDMSNAVTRWVTETILQQDDLKKRANIVKHFVLIAERCLSLNNFSTLIHIIAGLNSTPIHRLRRTWETVNQKSMISLGMLNNIMRPDKNYKEYRDQLRRVAPPCVPFLGVYLTDWTFIGDGNPDMLREKPHQINFNKRQKATELILMIKLHQSTTYNLAAVPVLAKYIEESLFPPNSDPANDDQRLYDMSLMREPRERDDEKIARLLSESGFL